ncbi:MAG: NAD(P)/FAD-dependent oxidoreductase [Candidatus Altiarchaeota archaeon]
MAIKCDILVIGAGPAGSSAARAAAINGAKTIFIDKKKEVGIPVKCAEGIGKYLFPYLPFKIPKEQLRWRIDGMIFLAENISIKREGEIWDGYTVDREKFDKWLSTLAIREGAKLFLDTELIDFDIKNDEVKKAIIRRNEKLIEIEPKVIIGADGVESTVLKLLGEYKPKRGHISEVHSWEMKNLKLKNPHFEQIYIGDFTPSGYAYIFPKSRTEANVGVGGIFPERKLEHYFEEFLNIKQVKEQLKDAKFVNERSKKAVVGDITNKWIHGNVLLAGDAANHSLKPFIEGILPAIISGNLAGELAAKMHKGEEVKMGHYLESIEKSLHPHFRASKELEEIIKRWFETKGREKHLLFLGLVAGLFELERLDEIEEMSYEALEAKLLEAKNGI